uniref:Uncharacterized protein n=1 Tax=Amphimedon queenslandica TaxID=400682 RepID=A0A1X7SJX1_AMPQE
GNDPSFSAYTENSAIECIALKAAFLLPLLLLQKPYRRSKAKDHLPALEHRFALWNDGEFMDLLSEGEEIQRKLSGGARRISGPYLCSSFSKLMLEGKVRGALKLLNNAGSSAGLPLLPSARVSGSDPPVLVKDMLINTPASDHEPLCFEFSQIDGGLIRNCFLKMNMGAAGPSGRVLINTYRDDFSLFLGDESIPSREGTTQGDPLAMAMFALATVHAQELEHGPVLIQA